MIVTIIHFASRDQIAGLMRFFGRLTYTVEGEMALDVPPWLEAMWESATR